MPIKRNLVSAYSYKYAVFMMYSIFKNIVYTNMEVKNLCLSQVTGI